MTRESFSKLKERICIADVLARYIDVDGQPTNNDQLRIPCIICDYDRNSLSINTSKNLFKCFHCGSQGNILDFVVALEGVETAQAGKLLIDWFPKTPKVAKPAKKKVQSRNSKPIQKSVTVPASGAEGRKPLTVNVPLRFELKGIDPHHELVSELGFTDVDIERYDIGYYSGRGSMSGKVIGPIRDEEDRVIGYCSFVNTDSGQVVVEYPKPEHFCKDSDLYLWPIARDSIADQGLHIVRCPYTAIILRERGYNAVAFMADVPGLNQIHQIHDMWQCSDATVTYSYDFGEKPIRLGCVIKVLADFPITVIPHP